MRMLILAAGAGLLALSAQADAQRVVIHDCPPGLAKKSPPCIPPGRVKHDFVVGRRVASDIDFITFNSIPVSVRTRFALRSSDRFVHRGDSLVVVNPRTRMVSRVVAVRF